MCICSLIGVNFMSTDGKYGWSGVCGLFTNVHIPYAGVIQEIK